MASRSVLVPRDRHHVLPLPKDQKVLVIEQINKTPNDFYWHPGILFKNCLKYNKNTAYLETAYTYDETDKANIQQAVKDFEYIVII